MTACPTSGESPSGAEPKVIGAQGALTEANGTFGARMAPFDPDREPPAWTTLRVRKGGAMTHSQRSKVVRTAADLATAIRSGNSAALDRTQRELVRIERNHRADRDT